MGLIQKRPLSIPYKRSVKIPTDVCSGAADHKPTQHGPSEECQTCAETASAEHSDFIISYSAQRSR